MEEHKKLIPLFGVVNLPEMEDVALEVMRSGKIASGEYVSKFEDSLGNLLGQKHVVTTVDMTSAMYLALHLSGVRHGDEVITTAFACMATNSPIATIGAKPVWVDLEKNSPYMSVSDFEAAITSNTKAVILYHLAGYPGPAQQIAGICKMRGIKLIEDCDNALLAEVDGDYVGSFGDFAVYSFYPNRQINTTEGSALICKNSEDAQRARKLRRLGIDSKTFRNSIGEINPKSDILEIGWSFTLNNLCSALGFVQIPSVIERLNRTRSNASELKKKISVIEGVTTIEAYKNSSPAYWALLIFLQERDNVLKNLKNIGVMASILHLRNDAYSGFARSSFCPILPNTDYLQEHILALPCGWWLDDESISFIAEVLRKSIH